MNFADDSERLNAFVDNELSAAESAALLRDIASHRRLAKQAAQLLRLKSLVHDSLHDLPCPLPDLEKIFQDHQKPHAAFPTAALRRLTASWRLFIASTGARLRPTGRGMVVAGLLAALLMALWSFPTSRNRLVAQAMQTHQAWIDNPPAAPISDLRPVAALYPTHSKVYIPDLQASKLRITHVARFGRNGLHVGYVGTRDCHLSLFIRPGTSIGPVALHAFLLGDSELFTWRTNQLDYLLLAAGMDKTRLRLIAQDTFQATRALQPFGPKMQLALRINRLNSPPCAG